MKFRIFDGQAFHEHGTSWTTEDGLLQQAHTFARHVAHHIARHKPGIAVALPPEKQLQHDFSSKPLIDPAAVPLADKVAFCTTTYGKIMASGKEFANAKVVLGEFSEVKVFASKHKLLSQHITGCRIVLMPLVKTSDGDTRYHYESFFKPGYEVTHVSDEKIQQIAAMALRIKDAKKISPGTYEAVLHPYVSGVLAHESFGHGMEADTIYKERAMAKEYLGKRIASSSVSIVENPAIEGKHGGYFFDDEGQLATPTYLVKAGIVGSPITDLSSAARMHLQRTANGRCESFDHKSYARMSTIYFEAGSGSKDAMIASIKDGYFLYNTGGGMEDPKGWGVQIQGILAERIKNGKLTGELFYEVGMTGFLPSILGSIAGISKEFLVEGVGSCGKGHKEWVRVADGGPYLHVKQVELS
ncbi:TldD/PmbA family protein [Candidatus Woesearchaeota archaeon]|nr:TldD/PmbA family protein [Candidatus Woesearchaeota archaeon]